MNSTTKRAIGIVICFSPVAVGFVSLAYAIAHPDLPRLRLSLVGGLAALVVWYNVYYSFIRPTVYRVRHGSLDGFRGPSVAPLLGTLFIFIESLIGFGSLYTALLVLLAYLLDTGGLPWMLASTWRDESMWDS
jgi:hypothetical protein